MRKRKIELAKLLKTDRCDCGCGQAYIYLCDGDEIPYASFTLDNDLWLPFAQDCVRISQGEEPLGPPQRVMQ
jgi:hypothetical protein